MWATWALLVRYSHFVRRFRQKWENVLRFASASGFPECDDCCAFKDAFTDCGVLWLNLPGIRVQSEDPLDRYTIAQGYKSHLDAVAADRKLEQLLQDRKRWL